MIALVWKKNLLKVSSCSYVKTSLPVINYYFRLFNRGLNCGCFAYMFLGVFQEVKFWWIYGGKFLHVKFFWVRKIFYA